MKAPITSILFTLFLTIGAPAAFAEGQRSKGMSQLDFDRPTPELVVKKPAADPIKEILSSPTASSAKLGSPDSSARASLATPPAVPVAPPAPTKFDWVKPSEGQSHMLIPRLKGPFADIKAKNTITTNMKWNKQGAACQDVTDAKSICGKSKALRELMSRFSGSDDFIDAQCTAFKCANPAEHAVLIGFAVKNVAGGAFKMIEEGKACRYQISSESTPPKWQLLEGERGTCQCVPATCF